jgi:hypothetical protein
VGHILHAHFPLPARDLPEAGGREARGAGRIARPALELLADPRLFPEAWGPDNLEEWPALDLAALAVEDALDAARAGGPFRIGVNRSPPGGTIRLGKGRRTLHPSGRHLWTYRLHVPGARAVRARLSRLELPAGAELAAAGASGEAIRVYAGDAAAPFWTALLPGDTVRLEVRSAPGDAGPPLVEVDEVSHIYRDPPLPGVARENVGLNGPRTLPCQVDVNCAEVPPAVRDAVGRVVFTAPAGTFTCSGALLEDLDPNTFAGYLLTANHCIDSAPTALSVEVHWFYQTDDCDGTVPSLEELPRSERSTLLATSPDTDFTLLRLADDPRDGQGFAAWTVEEPSGRLAGIHHPRGEHKRIHLAEPTSSLPICGSYPPSRFWYLDPVEGATETGSSGGPLFDSSWRVIGQLFGTCSIDNPGCSNPEDFNILYGKFGVTYPAIAEHLEAVAPDDVHEDNDSRDQAPAIGPGTHALRLVDHEDYFSVVLGGPGSIAAEAVFSIADMDLDLELSTAGGEVLASSAGTGRTESVAAMVPAGRYILRASKVRKWGGDYSLTVAIEVEPGHEPFLRADANSDGAVDISDPIFVLLHLFAGGREPHCADAADADDDGAIGITDAIRTLSWIITDGPGPPAPAGEGPAACGADPTEDAIGCEAFGPCAA